MSELSAVSPLVDFNKEEESTSELPIINDYKSSEKIRLTNGKTISEKDTDLLESANEKENLVSNVLNEYSSRRFWYKKEVSVYENFISLQRWEGHVIKITRSSFWARLFNFSDSGIVEEAKFSKEEIDKQDEDLLDIGSIFTWNIGYLDRPSGRSRISIIRFRRLPTWSQCELAKAKSEAAQFIELFKNE